MAISDAIQSGFNAIGAAGQAVGDMVKQDVQDVMDVSYRLNKSGFNPFVPDAAKDFVADTGADIADRFMKPVNISVNRDRHGKDLAGAIGNSILTVGSIIPGVAAAKAGVTALAKTAKGVAPAIKTGAAALKVPKAAKGAVKALAPKNWTKPMLQKIPVTDKTGKVLMKGYMGNRVPVMKISGIIPPRNKAFNRAMSHLDDTLFATKDAWNITKQSVSKGDLREAAKFAAKSAKQGVKSSMEFARDFYDDYKNRRKKR